MLLVTVPCDRLPKFYFLFFFPNANHATPHATLSSPTNHPPPSPLPQPKKINRGFYQRLKGKQGRFRGNLSGKRVNFSGRTVISPDPNLGVDEVAVPLHVCRILTFPERVNDANLQRLRAAVKNGPHKYPGAEFVESVKEARMRNLRFANCKAWGDRLSIGDIVHRHLVDGDYVLFNRQPSLHRMSIMCHKVKARPWRTFRFNECVCKPYNADFDGDEMNLHVPQTEEARAEAANLMLTTNNLCTPCNGSPLIAACQDFITGAYLLTHKDVFLPKSRAMQLATYMGDGSEVIKLPPPAIMRPVQLWTGKQIASLILRPGPQSRLKLNLSAPNRSCNKRHDHETSSCGAVFNLDAAAPTDAQRSLCHEDGYVIVRNSQLIAGFWDKAIIGESKSTVFYRLMRDYTPGEAANCMRRLSKVTTRFLMERGFSIGIEDVTPSASLIRSKGQFVKESFAECQRLVQAFRTSTDADKDEGTLEMDLRKNLNDIREKGGEACRETMPASNAPHIMAKCGSKGSNINMAQMIACVGQQIINGERVSNGFEGRPLPHFEHGALEPSPKGFVLNSFYTGLTPTEFFFHTMSGREGEEGGKGGGGCVGLWRGMGREVLPRRAAS